MHLYLPGYDAYLPDYNAEKIQRLVATLTRRRADTRGLTFNPLSADQCGVLYRHDDLSAGTDGQRSWRQLENHRLAGIIDETAIIAALQSRTDGRHITV